MACQSPALNRHWNRLRPRRSGSGAGAEGGVTLSRYPRFVGARIGWEGGDRADVQLNVTQAVSALTGLSSERISVVKGMP